MTAPDPAKMMAAVGERRAALLTQCPSPSEQLSVEDLARYPVNVIDEGRDGPLVVIVHGGVQGGLGGGPATFDRQRELSERGWRLRLIERPGFGQSPSRGADDMEADANLVAKLLDDGAHLVGHSWGGAAALLAASRRPNLVRSLTLVEPALFPMIMTDPALRADPRMQAVGGQMAGLILRSETPADYAINFAQALLGPPDDEEVKKRVAGLKSNPELAARVGCAALNGKIAAPDAMRAAADAIATAKIPTLVICGGWSDFFDKVGQVVARFTGGKYVEVSAAHHMVQQVSGDAFNEVLEDFMRSAETGRIKVS
ncbi:MAG: hydrolase [Bradyrhizobium sp.]|nr:hydrolase [Bradyrhizobium sp.]